MKLSVLFCLSIILCVSCINQESNIQPVDVSPGTIIHSDSVVDIKIDVPKIGYYDMTEKISYVKYIPLETSSKSLIGEISKVIFYKDCFYILDKEITNSIFIFDQNGRFVKKINNEGRGPGEYGKLTGFKIDQLNDQLVIFSEFPTKIIRTSMTGEYISEIHPPCFSYKFELLPGKNYAVYAEYDNNSKFQKEDYNLIYLDSLSNIKMGFLKYNHASVSNQFYKYPNNFYTYKENVFFYPTLIDTIYRLGLDGIKPVYALDFGEIRFNKEILQQDVSTQESYFLKRSYPSLWGVSETDKVLLVSFSYMSVLYSCYISKTSHTTMVSAMWKAGNHELGRNVGSCEQFLINRLDQLNMMHVKACIQGAENFDENLIKIAKDYKESDNPVLVTYDMNF